MLYDDIPYIVSGTLGTPNMRITYLTPYFITPCPCQFTANFHPTVPTLAVLIIHINNSNSNTISQMLPSSSYNSKDNGIANHTATSLSQYANQQHTSQYDFSKQVRLM